MAQQKDELASFVIPKLEGLENRDTIGGGSYGAVYEVKVNGLPSIAKRLHDILLGLGRHYSVRKEDRDSAREKFRRECVLLSRLRHPNIVQFLGVHYGDRDQADITLVMEYMYMDLDCCLNRYPNIPLHIKLSILLDVSYGLLHLHAHQPPIIHRDLTAANVLLTRDMRAKIADLGTSKILEQHPLHQTAHTTAPGTYAYMPPEALVPKPTYSVKLDIFSFGVLSLYVAIQQFPYVYEGEVTYTMFQKRELQLRKRMRWLEMMTEKHCCYSLVKECLQDNPVKRPSTSGINSSLKQLATHYPWQHENILGMQLCKEQAEQRAQTSREELDKLWCEVQAYKFQAITFKEDFEEERRDRERAYNKLGTVEFELEKMKQKHQAMVESSREIVQAIHKFSDTVKDAQSELTTKVNQYKDGQPQEGDKVVQQVNTSERVDKYTEKLLTPKMLCKMAGCSFRGVEELNSYCPDCYEAVNRRQQFVPVPQLQSQPVVQWPRQQPHPAGYGVPVTSGYGVPVTSGYGVPVTAGYPVMSGYGVSVTSGYGVSVSSHHPQGYLQQPQSPPQPVPRQFYEREQSPPQPIPRPTPKPRGPNSQSICKTPSCFAKAVPELNNLCPPCFQGRSFDRM